jgi:ketosteroid isomerase-like protein
MNTRKDMHRTFAALAALLLTLALAACGAGMPQASPPTDPLGVVQQHYKLLNEKKLDEAMALTADDYVMSDPGGSYNRASARQRWQEFLDGGFTFEQTNFADQAGRVTSCYLVRENGTEIDQGCNAVTHVRKGKIVFDGLVPAENIWVVQRYYDALNNGDVDSAARAIAEDAVFINPTGNYQGKAAIVASLRAQIEEGLTFELSNFREQGGRVAYDYIVKAGGAVLDTGSDGLTIVKDGQIIFDGTERSEPAQ